MRKKRVLLVVAAAVAVVLLQFLMFQKRHIPLENNWSLDVPGMWSRVYNGRCQVTHVGGKRQVVCDVFSHPLMVLPTATNRGVMVLYDFDVRVDMIEFGSQGTQTALPESVSYGFDQFVLTGDIPARPATAASVAFALDLVSRLSERDVRRMSVPTIDLGLFKMYVSKDILLDSLRRLADARREYAR